MMFRRTGVLVVVSILAVGAAHAQSAPTVIQLKPYLGGAWSFEADVGKGIHRFLFDTGGGITVITPEAAAEAGCKPWGQMTGFRMRGDRVDMKRCDHLTFHREAHTILTPTAGVLDFAKLLPPDAPELGGSIALDSFADRIVTLDLSNQRIILETGGTLSERIAAGKEVKLHLAREIGGRALVPFVAVETMQGVVWMQLDTGSDASVVVGDHNADALSLVAGSNDRQRLRTKLAGGVPLDEDAVRVMPLVIDGNIGSLVLRKWVVTLDLRHERAWIALATTKRVVTP